VTAQSTATLDAGHAGEYLEQMFASVPGRISLSYTTAKGGMAYEHFNLRPQAVARAAEWDRLHRPQGIYVRCTTLVAPEAMTGRRGGESDSLALPFLWADLDFGTVGHKPANGALPLPPTAEDALKIIADLPTPSLIAHSGGGRYPIWQLDQPVLINDDNRADVKALSVHWQAIIHDAAEQLGWSYGSGVGDLARVLRLPGSINRKAGQERPSRVVERTGEVHTWAALNQAADRLSRPRPAAQKAAPPPRINGDSVLDKFADSTTWADILGPAGWTLVASPDNATLEAWQRPGGTHPVSAKVLADAPHALVVWSEDAGLPAGAGQKLTKGRVYAHLHHHGDLSAASKGLSGSATAAHPKAVADSITATHPKAVADGITATDDGITATDDGVTATDDGNALRLINEHGHNFRRVADMRRWFHWDGKRWAMDHEHRAIRAAARELARQLPEDSKEEKLFKRNSMSAIGISGAVRVAEVDRRISILAAELDARPHLLNTPTGVVDLRTAIVEPHNPDLLLTRITAYGVDLETPHPTWDRFLKETFGESQSDLVETDLVAYLQRLAGLALLGSIREHVLPFLHGVGANGKGVLTLVLQGLLGDADNGGYAVSAPDGFLMTGRDGAHPTEIARLRGARLVVCSEQTSGKRFDESKVKRLTGGDMLTGRFMRGDFFDFTPSHLMWVLSNHLPAVREGGPSFWRRVRLIPFRNVVPEDKREPDLHEQLLESEGPAILGWAVRGAVQVTTKGLADPNAVIKATKEYEVSEDTLASFIRDECLVGKDWWCTVAELRSRYERHCHEMGAEPLTAKALGMRLTSEYPVTSGKANRGLRVYRGINLTPLEEVEA